MQNGYIDERTSLLRNPSAIRGTSTPEYPDDENNSTVVYKTYRLRWIVLADLFLVSFCNAVIWISYSTIIPQSAKYYNVSSSTINWFAEIYLIITIIFGIFAAYILDSSGLRITIILSAYLNVFGMALRVFSNYTCKFPIALTGQGIAAFAQPLAVFAPTKLAALWFNDRQRTTANMIASMANPIGIMVGSFIAPLIVKRPENIFLMNIVILSISSFTAILSTFTICSALPPTPPCATASFESQTFIQGLKLLKSNKQFWMLAVSFGIGLAIFTTLTALLEQILCPFGYDSFHSGCLIVLLIASGLIGAGISSIIVDKYKNFEEAVKIAFALGTLSFILFSIFRINIGMYISLALFGFFGLALYPICNELAVESTYPIAEGTSSGLLFLIGQVVSVVFMFICYKLGNLKPIKNDIEKCESNGFSEAYDFIYSLVFLASILSIVVLFFIIGYKCPFKRRKAEEELIADRILRHARERDINI